MANFIIEDLKRTFKSRGNALSQIIIINVGIWVFVKIVESILKLSSLNTTTFLTRFEEFIGWLALPAALETLIIRPWTLVSYMFLHEGFWHILFNMLWLYWFGKILREYLGNRRFVSTYLLGGLAGGALYLLIYNLVEFTGIVIMGVSIKSILLGASASVMAVVFATATQLPNHTIGLMFIGPVKLRYVALFALIFTTFIGFADNVGGNLAHIGGALYGYVYIRNLQRGKDYGSWLNRLLDQISRLFRKPKKIKVVHKRKRPARDDYAYNANKVKEQQRTDAILDKISKSGYESLSKEEKDFLFNISNRS